MSRSSAPLPVKKRTAPTAKRQRTTDSELASYQATAQRVLEEHERREATPAHAHARARSSPSPAAPARTPQAAAQHSVALAAAAENLEAARRSLALTQRRAASRAHHDSLAGFGPRHPAAAALAEAEHDVQYAGVDADGNFSGASVFVVCQHGALMGRAGGIWQDFGGRRDGNETPYETAFRELREEIGLTASHVDILPDQPVWVCHAGYRHAVFVATLSEANRLRPDWNNGDEETPELDAYSCSFVDFANFFADDMFGTEFVHRRIKTREIFDLANEAYVDMRRAAHRAKAAAGTDASSDSDDADSDGGDDDDGSPPAPPRQQPASKAASSASQLDSGAGWPGAASCVAAPIHGRPPDTAAAAADAAGVLVSAPARVPRAVAEHEQTSNALTSYHTGSESPTAPATPSST